MRYERLGQGVLACGLCGAMLIVAGCGPAEQEYSEPAVTVKTTPVDEVRAWLQGVADSGVIDSGVDITQEQIASLDVPNKDQLVKEMAALRMQGNPGQVKAKAEEMLKLLPPKM